MGKTISIYIDDELLEEIKEKKIPLSKAIRSALREWLEKEAKEEDYDFIEKALYNTIGVKGKKAWKELLEERDRW